MFGSGSGMAVLTFCGGLIRHRMSIPLGGCLPPESDVPFPVSCPASLPLQDALAGRDQDRDLDFAPRLMKSVSSRRSKLRHAASVAARIRLSGFSRPAPAMP